MIGVLRDSVDAIAPDTPGYGASDPLPEPAPDLAPYTRWLREFVRELGLQRVGLYGSATGAQIAIEFARAYPHVTRFVLLDNVAHFRAEERERMLARYFPDLSPHADGRHLQTAWSMVCGLGQWFLVTGRTRRTASRNRQPYPSRLLAHMSVDHLRPGPDTREPTARRCATRNADGCRASWCPYGFSAGRVAAAPATPNASMSLPGRNTSEWSRAARQWKNAWSPSGAR